MVAFGSILSDFSIQIFNEISGIDKFQAGIRKTQLVSIIFP
jgi:hypothetical protein